MQHRDPPKDALRAGHLGALMDCHCSDDISYVASGHHLCRGFVLLEDAFNDEQSILDTHLTVEDPVLLITIEDGPCISMLEVRAT